MDFGKLAGLGRLTMVVGLLATTAACATVVGGTTQEVYVDTEPKAAACTANRQGATVGVIKSTPGKVGLARSKETVILSCTLEGYEQSNEVLVASFTGATVGNILLGGLVGVAIDAASGANNKYPERVMVVLTPASFPSDEARDAHYAGIRQRIEAGAKAEIDLVNTRCSSTNRELCTIEAKQIADARDKAVADLDKRRLAAKVIPA